MKVRKRRIVIGVTGSLGSGKTTVAKFFARYGAKVINADALVEEIYKTRKDIVKKIVRAFGRDILIHQGLLDKKALAKKAFKNKRSLKILHRVMHPLVKSLLKKEIRKYSGVVVVDAPLLVESGFHKYVDYVVLVKSNLASQLRRARQNFNLSQAEVSRRLRYQLAFKNKMRFAHFIVDNRSSLKQLQEQVEKIYKGVAKWR